MGQKSEAACLLETGALYTRRLGLKPATEAGDLVFAGLKHGTFSLYFGDEPIYHFDLEGRWQRAYIAGRHYLKSLDGSINALDRIREGKNLVLHRRVLSFAETSDLDYQIRGDVIELLGAFQTDAKILVEPPSPVQPIEPDRLRSLLDRVAQWDSAAWFSQRERYLATYAPFGFLPPEAQQSVILQAAVGDRAGCSFGQAPDPSCVLRTPAEFAQHARSARALWGRRALQCRWTYLTGSALLSRPKDEIAAYLRAATSLFPVDRSLARVRQSEVDTEQSLLSGVVSFVDCLDARLPDRTAWSRLRDLNLSRVVIGVESGNPGVRALYEKHWPNEALAGLVADLKAVDLEVSLVLLVGAGGQEDAEAHVIETARLINALELGAGDLVYLIDATQPGGDSLTQRLQDQKRTALSPAAVAEQQAELLKALVPVRTQRKAKVVPYALEKQLL